MQHRQLQLSHVLTTRLNVIRFFFSTTEAFWSVMYSRILTGTWQSIFSPSNWADAIITTPGSTPHWLNRASRIVFIDFQMMLSLATAILADHQALLSSRAFQSCLIIEPGGSKYSNPLGLYSALFSSMIKLVPDSIHLQSHLQCDTNEKKIMNGQQQVCLNYCCQMIQMVLNTNRAPVYIAIS